MQERTELQPWQFKLRDIVKKSGLTQAELSRRAGISPQLLSNWLNKNCGGPDGNAISKLTNVLNISTDWLLTDVGSPSGLSNVIAVNPDHIPPGCVAIKEYQISASCGLDRMDGDLTWEEINCSAPRFYHEDFFKKLGVNPKNCIRIKSTDDSMAPTIAEGDTLLVDISQAARTRLVNNAIYVIYYDGTTACKRLIKQIGGGLDILSDNKSYVTEHLSAETQVPFYIVGRVLERCGTIS